MEDKINFKQGVQTVERALKIFEMLNEKCSDGCSIKFLSDVTSLHKSTVHRLLHTLIDLGYAYQDNKSELYYPSLKILEMSTRLLSEMDIIAISKPFLKSICNETSQVIQLSIQNNDNAIFIDKVENPNQSVRMYSQIGKAIPVYCSSSGKALLAWKSDEYIRSLISYLDFKTFTSTTVKDGKELLAQLNDTRAKGYATDMFEHEENICCLAAPIINSQGKVIAAVSIASTILQITPSNYIHFAVKINETAYLISKQLGCQNYPAVFSQILAKKDAEICEQLVKEKYRSNAFAQ